MRVIAVVATGRMGSAVVAVLAKRHDVVKVGYHDGDFQVDLASPDSISKLFRSIGSFDTTHADVINAELLAFLKQ